MSSRSDMQSVMIHGRLPSLNEYVDACRRNRYAAAKMKRDAEELILWQVKRMKPITSKVWVQFVWHEENRMRDPDNVCFAKKFVLDALQKCGKLKNDNSKYIAGFNDRFIYGKEYGVLMEVAECKE